MNRLRAWQIALSGLVILAAVPGAHSAAHRLDADELIWLIPMVPAFTVVFFWIVDTLVRLFIQNDAYKDPAAIKQAHTFLRYFGVFFPVIWTLFLAAEFLLERHFRV